MKIEELSLEEKIGQMLCFAFRGTSYNDQLKTLIEDYHLGNIVYFAHNIASINQAKTLNNELQKHAKHPLFISLDQEGGMVRRIIDDITYLPGAMSLNASLRENIYQINYYTGLDLKSLGFNVNYAPVGDINNNPLNPVINSRSYGDDPKIVSDCVLQAFSGMQDALMLPTVKHFPGHGDTNVDSHLGLPIVNKSYEQMQDVELMPYFQAINKGLDGIMISHILYPQLDDKWPSTLSYNVITKLLKEKMGFKGLITTDSLTMAAIWGRYSIEEIVEKGVNAGNDVLVFCGKADLNEQIAIVKAFIKLVETNKISIDRINESVQKIINLKAKYCSLPNPTTLNQGEKLAVNLVNNSITKVFDNNLLPIKKGEKILIIFPKINLASLVDNENNRYETIGKYLQAEEIIIDENMGNYENVVQKSQNYDKIIMATYNVKKDDYQQKLFAVLDKAKTIVIALRSPYDLYLLPGVQTYLCTYDCTKESIQAVSNHLITNHFTGKLPITLSR